MSIHIVPVGKLVGARAVGDSVEAIIDGEGDADHSKANAQEIMQTLSMSAQELNHNSELVVLIQWDQKINAKTGCDVQEANLDAAC